MGRRGKRTGGQALENGSPGLESLPLRTAPARLWLDAEKAIHGLFNHATREARHTTSRPLRTADALHTLPRTGSVIYFTGSGSAIIFNHIHILCSHMSMINTYLLDHK